MKKYVVFTRGSFEDRGETDSIYEAVEIAHRCGGNVMRDSDCAYLDTVTGEWYYEANSDELNYRYDGTVIHNSDGPDRGNRAPDKFVRPIVGCIHYPDGMRIKATIITDGNRRINIESPVLDESLALGLSNALRFAGRLPAELADALKAYGNTPMIELPKDRSEFRITETDARWDEAMRAKREENDTEERRGEPTP